MHDSQEPGTVAEQLLFTEARLRIAVMQLEQAEDLCDAESERARSLTTDAGADADGATAHSARLRAEITSVAVAAAEGRVEALRLELTALHDRG